MEKQDPPDRNTATSSPLKRGDTGALREAHDQPHRNTATESVAVDVAVLRSERLPAWIHGPGCGCLGCADFRERMRARGVAVKAALDWRGLPLPGGR